MMTWILAFLVAHAVEIAAIGTTAYAINQVTQTAVTAVHLVKDAKEDEKK